jgi:pyruvate/2-oxoglutarate dehydrogenase complex dihydrolipoamide dehydrogenase (E3) component
MATPQQYDAIVIGASTASVSRFCPTFAQAGWKIALIEREHVGGTCVNVGCMPTKTLVASARVAYLARRAAEYGVLTAPVTVDMAAVWQRKQQLVGGIRHFAEGLIDQADGVDLIRGEARFTGPKALDVCLHDGGVRQLTADTIVIDTGARPGRPSIPGLERVSTLDSTSIMELDTLPDHLLVLGGGYVGLEFSQMFRRFGSQVTILQSGKQLLARENPDVAQAITAILREDGVEVLLEAHTSRAEPTQDGKIALTVSTPEEAERTLIGSHLLVATGRVPNTERLHLEAAGIQTDTHGAIQVNERLETSVPGVYALGDVKGAPAFTHVAYHDVGILRINLLEGGQASTTGRLIPTTVFIDPQLGRVGLTETEARSQGHTIRVTTLPMAMVLRAMDVGETRGFMKAIVDADTEQILGAAILGIEGGEIMAVIQTAMLGQLPYTALRDGILAHPTLAEGLTSLFAALER